MQNRVGLGTFPLSSVFSEVSKEEAKKIVKAFLVNGGYYIDTAPIYGFGEVESLLGEALQNFPRGSYYMATKCGYIGIEDNNPVVNSEYKHVIEECEKSLKRLKTNYIDLYFVHCPDPNTPLEETIKALTELQDKGKIKEIGVSNVNLEELKEYNKTGVVKFVQNRFSLINRSIDKEFGEYLVENKILLIPYQVIERGQLTNRVLGEIKLRGGDFRHTKPDWEEEKLSVVTGWVKEEIYPIAQKTGAKIEQLAIAWTLHQPFLDFAIVGATNAQQVLTNLKANKIKLTDDVLEEIDNAYHKLRSQIKEKYSNEVHEFRGLNEKFY